MTHQHGKCDCAQKGDVDLTSVKSMKAFLQAHHVSHDDCFAKEDLVARVITTQKKLDAAAVSSKKDDSKSDAPQSAGKSRALIRTKAVGPLACNMTIVADVEKKEGVLVDPGGDADKILSLIKEMDVKIVQILVTHCHFDHILAAGEVRKATGAPICFNKLDMDLWKMLPLQCMLIGMQGVKPIDGPQKELADGEKLAVLDGVSIHTPGHTPGSMCFYFASEKLLLSGDTLFHTSVGRTDLPGGDGDAIVRSIQERLYTLPDDTKVIPGHNDFTSIGFEKKNNLVVKARSKI